MIPRVLLVLLAVALLSDPAAAHTLGGPDLGWTRMAFTVFDEAMGVAMWAIVIGIVALGVALLSGLQVTPVINMCVAGGILTLGGAAISVVLGAELPVVVP